VRRDDGLKKRFVPGVEIQGPEIADLPPDPIPTRKVALEFSDALE
jgi:hypothetical protein